MNNRDFDRVIRDSLESLHVPAPSDAWEMIESGKNQRRKRRIVLLIRIAASIAILIGVSLGVIMLNTLDHPSDVITQTQENQESIQHPSVEHEAVDSINTNDLSLQHFNNESGILSTPASSRSSSGEIKANLRAKPVISSETTEKTFSSEIPLPSDEQAKITALADHNVSGQEAQEEIMDAMVTDEKSTLNKPDDAGVAGLSPIIPDLLPAPEKNWNWSIGGLASPLYSFRNTREASQNPLYYWGGGEANEAGEKPLIAFSAGMSVELEKNRWSFSSGIYYLEQGQQIEDFNINKVVSGPQQSMIFAATSLGNLQIDQNSSSITGNLGTSTDIPFENLFSSEPVRTDASLLQSFGFIEIPFLAGYKLIDRRIDLQIIGGISSGFLVDNRVVLEYMGKTREIGQVENVHPMNLNSVAGLGVMIPFSNRFRFQLQPLFRYALQPFNKDYSVMYYPWSMAVYSGFIFHF